MPLTQRFGQPAAATYPPKVQIPVQESVLQSQPLSPTKLKVTRQVAKTQQDAAALQSPKPEPPPPAQPEEVCLRWNSHHSNMQTSFPQLLEKECYVDVTLAAEGKVLKCHKVSSAILFLCLICDARFGAWGFLDCTSAMICKTASDRYPELRLTVDCRQYNLTFVYKVPKSTKYVSAGTETYCTYILMSQTILELKIINCGMPINSRY